MINTIFILNSVGNVLFEKHYHGKTEKSVAYAFWDQLIRETDIYLAPVIVVSKCFVFHSKHSDKRGATYFLGVCDEEVSPISVSEFLLSVVDLFCQYFGASFDEAKLKSEFVRVYQLLDIIIDDGKPFSTELAQVLDFAPLNSISNRNSSSASRSSNPAESFTGVGSAIKKSGPLAISSENYNQSRQAHNAGIVTSYSLSNASLGSPQNEAADIQVAWRKPNTSHLRAGIYFDFVENMDVIIDPNGVPIVSEIVGFIQVRSELRGMPEVNVSFVNPSLLNDVCFSRCVRRNAWENRRTLEFVPPDGTFKLLTYRVKSGVSPPLTAKSSFVLTETGGRISVTISMKQLVQGAQYFPEKLVVDIPLPKSTMGVNFVATVGSFTFEKSDMIFRWQIGDMPKRHEPRIQGTFIRKIEEKEESPLGTVKIESKQPTENQVETSFHPTLVVHFGIPGYSASGARIDQIDVRNVDYTPFKGVKSITYAGSYQIRN